MITTIAKSWIFDGDKRLNFKPRINIGRSRSRNFEKNVFSKSSIFFASVLLKRPHCGNMMIETNKPYLSSIFANSTFEKFKWALFLNV